MSVEIWHRADWENSAAPTLVDDGSAFQATVEQAKRTEAIWAEKSRESAKKGREWYNGTLWSPVQPPSATSNQITVRKTWFKDFVGTRRDGAGVPMDQRVGPLSVAILPVVVDKIGGRVRHIRFFRRSGNSLDFAGYFSGLGGLMDPDKDGVDPVKTAIREVREESGLVIGPENLTYLGTACIKPECAVAYCYAMEIEKSAIDQGLVFADGEITHSLGVPIWLARAITWPVVPAAGWVKAFARMLKEQHSHRLP